MRSQPEFLNRVALLDPLLWLPKLNARRVRVQQIMNESNTPRSCKEHIAAAAPPTARVVAYDDAFTFYSEWSGGKLFCWVKEQLRAVPQSHAAATKYRTRSVLAPSYGQFVTPLWQHRTEFLDASVGYRRNKGLAEIARWHCECDGNERCSKRHWEGTARRVPSRVQP